jgi:hypothetical protein
MISEGALDIRVELTAARRLGWSRYFFFGLGVLCILAAVVGFGPNLNKNFNGVIFFPPIVHVHATILMGWLLLYTVQAGLAVRGISSGIDSWVG